MEDHKRREILFSVIRPSDIKPRTISTEPLSRGIVASVPRLFSFFSSCSRETISGRVALSYVTLLKSAGSRTFVYSHYEPDYVAGWEIAYEIPSFVDTLFRFFLPRFPTGFAYFKEREFHRFLACEKWKSHLSLSLSRSSHFSLFFSLFIFKKGGTLERLLRRSSAFFEENEYANTIIGYN